jgi:transcription antitermination factor NusG
LDHPADRVLLETVEFSRISAHSTTPCPGDSNVDPLTCSNQAAPEWFALQVWAGREGRTANQLRQRAYDVFLPCHRERRRWSDRIKICDRPLFAGYLFCRLQTSGIDRAERLVTTPGVIRIVRNEHGPLPIPSSEIDAIQRIVDLQVKAEAWPFLRAGQRVTVERGPLRGTEGIVLHSGGGQSLVVSISILQRSVAVQMEPDWVGSCD